MSATPETTRQQLIAEHSDEVFTTLDRYARAVGVELTPEAYIDAIQELTEGRIAGQDFALMPPSSGEDLLFTLADLRRWYVARLTAA